MQAGWNQTVFQHQHRLDQARYTGCGIEDQRVATLLENFEDFKGATSSKYGGTGLGLPLSRKLCRLMGGDIAVESVVEFQRSF